MKSKIFRDIVIFFALVSLASDCNKEDHDPPEGFDTLIVKKISVTPETGNTNTEFKFIAEWMVSFEDPLIMCRWDFNYTGEEDIFWDTDWGADEITHTFESKGDYIIFVEAKNGVIGHDVEHALKSTNLTVSLPDNTPPLASFTVNPDIGFPNESFTVDASSSLDVEDPIEMLQVRWDWEDDGTYDTEYTTEKLADHAYQEPGNYTIKLQVKDTEELTGEKTLDVIVEVPGGNPCPGAPTVSDVDGNEYPTVLIGDQCWMKENLKTTKYNDGTPIPNVQDGTEWYWITTGAYVWYENDNTWKEKYGALYNWKAVNNPGGLCPTGWHVPTKNELIELTDYIGGTGFEGEKIKSCRQINSPLAGDCNTTEHPRWNETSNITYFGTDIYGFSGLPGGQRPYYNNCNFSGLGTEANWWSSTQTPSSEFNAYYLNLSTQNTTNLWEDSDKLGQSVRCLKND